MEFKHFLITRFNLKNSKWGLTKNKESVLTEQWMTHRMELFENFCLPSILSQTNQNFEWLIYFDTSTPENFKKRINDLFKQTPNIIPLFIDGMSSFYPSLRAEVIKRSTKIPYLITSRIDNDDCINKDFIDTIQQQFNRQSFEAIDPLEGYTIQINDKVLLGKKEHIYNPFISLIEKNEEPKTVWTYMAHPQWKREKNVKQIKGKRLWLSIIHAKNKVNQFDGYGEVDWQKIHKDFILSASVQTYISEHLVPYKEWRLLAIKNWIKINYTLLSKRLKRNIGLYKLK